MSKPTLLIRLLNNALVMDLSQKCSSHTEGHFESFTEKKAHSIQSSANGCLRGKHADPDPPAASLMSERELTQPSMMHVGYSEEICKMLQALLTNICGKARLELRLQSRADIGHVTAT